jgi:PKD repeat protein
VNYFLLSLSVLFLTSCSLVSTLTDEGDPPIISGLSVTPDNGQAPLASSIRWQIINTSTKPVTCTVDFNDGKTQTVENCSQISDVFHTYEVAGGYIIVLTATQGKHEVSRSFPVTVQGASPPLPGGAAISELSVTPEGGVAPLLTAIKWQLTGLKEPVTCNLDFGDGQQQTIENCSQVSDTFHTYEASGGYVLVLKAKDAEQEVTKSLPITVQAPKAP